MCSRSCIFHHSQSSLCPLLDGKAKRARCGNGNSREIVPRNLNLLATAGIFCPSNVASPIQARHLQKQRLFRDLQARTNSTAVAKSCESFEIRIGRQGFLVGRIARLQPPFRSKRIWLRIELLVTENGPLIGHDDGIFRNVVAFIYIVLGDRMWETCFSCQRVCDLPRFVCERERGRERGIFTTHLLRVPVSTA